MRAGGYCRGSSEGQAAEGVSLDAQRARIEAWCAARGAILVDILVDAGISGYRKENRPGLKAALVRTGKFRAADLDGQVHPDVVFNSIADLPGWLDRFRDP